MAQNKKQILVNPVLRWVFLFDAIGTGIFALLLMLLAKLTGELIGVESTITIQIVGIGSIFPASFSFWAARKEKLPAILVLLFATMCLIWVIGSIILMYLVPFTVIGMIGIATVAFLVALGGSFLYYFYYTR
ncbi:hypothetical protein SAMN05444392_10492 [Seinonella peptonophila]|uniref:Uncharacterized protein n=1 Tax=Seinonella peptonophila TaxID=112248 RepID=A0A1M4X375_9BACL|nr:hypothetical protein [Seinonella peptonophila]SHE87783.1 hypothetical protein SAMN05444392_10492 [Seinonella peptonophila]